VIVISIVGIVAFLVLGILAVIPWQISGIMITVFIGVASLVLTYLSKEKAHVKEPQITEKAATKQTVLPKPHVIVDETSAIRRGDYAAHDLGEQGAVEIKGEISSNEPVNFYFLTQYGLNRYKELEECSYECGSERSLKSSVSFFPSRTVTWYLAVENVGKKQATVHVYLYTEGRTKG